MSLLEAVDLTHVFPDGTRAIERVNVGIDAGEFVVLAGQNGSGKTVLIRHFIALLKPTSGRVLFDGRDVVRHAAQARRRIGMVFQDADSQFVGQTVAEDIAFGLRNIGVGNPEIQQRLNEVMEDLSLSHLSHSDPHLLSGGEKRRVALAGVLVLDPDIVILDEPFSNLDYPGVVHILELLLDLHRRGHTVLVVTHDLEKVLAHASRLLVMHRGRLAEDGDPARIYPRVASYRLAPPSLGLQEMTWLK